MLRPDIAGRAHTDPSDPDFRPFTIGRITKDAGYIHVFDDTTLDIVLSTLDTAPDFIRYLQRKEALISAHGLIGAAGEEDLLSVYLRRTDSTGLHDFDLPNDQRLVLLEGGWEEFENHPERKAQVAADRISYLWDGLIETFNHYATRGELHYSSHQSVAEFEEGVRLMASETRVRRRMLSTSLSGILRQGNDLTVQHGSSLRGIPPSLATFSSRSIAKPPLA